MDTNYKIIGGDQKEYGPVTGQQLRQWVAEGRANGQTLVQAEGQEEWKPLSAWPEFADLFAGAPAPLAPLGAGPVPGAPPPSPETVLNRDYDLDIGSCVSRSWRLVTQHFWPVVGSYFLVLILQLVIGQIMNLFDKHAVLELSAAWRQEHRIPAQAAVTVGVFSLIPMLIGFLFNAGLFNYYLKLIRGQPTDIGDVFSGFSAVAGQILLAGFFSALLSLIGLLFCVLPGIYLSVGWAFVLPLVIDRRMNFWEAMELSRRVVTKHWFLVFALLVVLGLMAIAGALACCLPLLFSVPLCWVALMYAYEDIFSRPV